MTTKQKNLKCIKHSDNMVESKVNEGFVYVTNYSIRFKELIQSIAKRAEQAIPGKKLNGIAIFLFDS